VTVEAGAAANQAQHRRRSNSRNSARMLGISARTLRQRPTDVAKKTQMDQAEKMSRAIARAARLDPDQPPYWISSNRRPDDFRFPVRFQSSYRLPSANIFTAAGTQAHRVIHFADNNCSLGTHQRPVLARTAHRTRGAGCPFRFGMAQQRIWRRHGYCLRHSSAAESQCRNLLGTP
jgi:hypothetical protein